MADMPTCVLAGNRRTTDRANTVAGVVRLADSWALVTIVCLACWAFMRWAFFLGFEGSDDMFYARFAVLWHHAPTNQWEVRLLGNALIGLAVRLLGYSAWSPAVPSLVASLVVLFCTLYGCYRFATVRHAWWAGLFVATLPVEVCGATIVSAHSVMAGFMAAGTLAFVLAPDSRRARLIASVCLPMGVLAHLIGLYYVGSLLAAALLVDRRRFARTMLMVCVSGALFMAADMFAFHTAYGDFLHRYRTTMPQRIEPETDLLHRHLDLESILWSLQQLTITKHLGVALAVVWVGAFSCYRRLNQPIRVLLWASLISWLYLSFGSYVPWSYRPFYRCARYLHPIVPALAIAFAAVVMQVRSRRLRYAMALGVPGIGLLLLSLSGSWGQNMITSRELADYARRHPERRFVADLHTLNEIYVINGFETPRNLWGTMDTASEHFMDPQIRRLAALDASNCDAILVNPLNVARTPSFAAILDARAGAVCYETERAYRPICRVIPWLERLDWSLRRPGARVQQLAPPGSAVTSSRPAQDSSNACLTQR